MGVLDIHAHLTCAGDIKGVAQQGGKEAGHCTAHQVLPRAPARTDVACGGLSNPAPQIWPQPLECRFCQVVRTEPHGRRGGICHDRCKIAAIEA